MLVPGSGEKNLQICILVGLGGPNLAGFLSCCVRQSFFFVLKEVGRKLCIMPVKNNIMVYTKWSVSYIGRTNDNDKYIDNVVFRILNFNIKVLLKYYLQKSFAISLHVEVLDVSNEHSTVT